MGMKPKFALKLQGQFFIYFTGMVLLVVLFVSIAIFYFQKQLILKQVEDKAPALTDREPVCTLAADRRI